MDLAIFERMRILAKQLKQRGNPDAPAVSFCEAKQRGQYQDGEAV